MKEVFDGMIIKIKMVSDNMFENINQIDTLLSGIEEGEVPIWAAPAVASVSVNVAIS